MHAEYLCRGDVPHAAHPIGQLQNSAMSVVLL
jgi:hypothetical protein